MLRRLSMAGIAVILIAGAAGVNIAHAQGLGFSFGANFAELGDIDAGDRRATFDNTTGWHIHLWFDLPLGSFAIRPGLRYMDAGKLFDDASVEDVPNPISDENARLFELPIDLRYRIGLPLVQPYVMAGPVVRLAASGADDRFRSLSLAGGVGVGVELGAGGVRLYPELKYTFGITRFTEESYDIGGITLSPDRDQRLNTIMLSLGLGF